jgi:NAD(P)-dependent dehydrogenase (short-subunit alcohol dehydrogenase family)
MSPDLTNVLHHTTYPSISPADPNVSAAGKTVVISGGIGGIGYGIAQGFSAAGAANVVIFARRQGALDEAAKRLTDENTEAHRVTKVWPYLLDIKDSEATDRVFNAVRQRLNDGGAGERDIDVLVANAAVLTQGKTALDFEIEAYRDAFETNVIGNLNLVRAFLAPEAPAIPLTNLKGETKVTKPLRQSHRTKVILDVSTSAWFAEIPGQAPYVASKLAFTRALRTLHSELSQLDTTPIRIHSFHPGLIRTPGTSKLVDESSGLVPWDDVSLPSHFAVWLASPAAAFTNGRFLVSSWDVEELMAMRTEFENDPTLCSITLKF